MADITTQTSMTRRSWFAEPHVPCEIRFKVYEQLFNPIVIGLAHIAGKKESRSYVAELKYRRHFLDLFLVSKMMNEEMKIAFFQYVTFSVPVEIKNISNWGFKLLQSGKIRNLALELPRAVPDHLHQTLQSLSSCLSKQSLQDLRFLRYPEKYPCLHVADEYVERNVRDFVRLGMDHARYFSLGVMPSDRRHQTMSPARACAVTIGPSRDVRLDGYLESSVEGTKDLLLRLDVLKWGCKIETLSHWPRKDSRNVFFVE